MFGRKSASYWTHSAATAANYIYTHQMISHSFVQIIFAITITNLQKHNENIRKEQTLAIAFGG